MIHKIGPFLGYDSNIYLLMGDKNVLIDTGTGGASSHVIEKIERVIGDSPLDFILLTHCHFDHVGGASDLVSRFGSKVYAGYIDASSIRNLEHECILDHDFGIDVTPVDVIDLHDGDIIDIGSHRLRVLETPGHTRGGVCYFDEISSSLFSGDTLFENGVGRTDFPGGSVTSLINSIKYIDNMGIQGLYPGHGPSTNEGLASVKRGLNIVGD